MDRVMIIRYGTALLLAIGIAIGLFAIMNHLIMDARKPIAETEDVRMPGFVSVQPLEQIRERSREQAKPPPPPLEQAPPSPMELAPAGQRPDLSEIEIGIPKMSIDMVPSLGELNGSGAVPTTTGGMTRPAITKAAFPPQYPQKAARSRIEGHVVVEFTVNTTGSVEAISIIESSPPKIFNKAAIRAISRYSFQPALKDGEPVASRARQRIDFQL